jgi:PAT family beta-lactamase induction signal transducer AmpG
MKAVARSWRLGSVALLSFWSGLPLGLVWIAIPAWLKTEGVDIKIVGLFTLAQAPWSFKFLWSPLMDRYPLPFMGRKRGWIFLSQIALLALGLWLAGVSDHPDAIWVIFAVTLATGFAAATQDIAYDAYTVEVLRREEQGAAVGARVAFYRVAMMLAGGTAITLLMWVSWPMVNLILALLYLPALLVTWKAPEPEVVPDPPKTLKAAVWEPFVGFMQQHRALEILLFVVLFKLSDALTQALTRPFFIELGFSLEDVGVGSSVAAAVATVLGTVLGGLLTNGVGLGRALWITGFLQIFSNLGYAALSLTGPSRLMLYGATFFELGTSGMGTGAFGVLLLRLTQKRFSATQFALLSSLMSFPRFLAGPPAGLMVDSMGWFNFYVFTIVTGIPGMIMLHRFVPWRVREPEFHVAAPVARRPLTTRGLVLRAAVAGLVGGIVSLLTIAAMWGMKSYRAKHGFNYAHQIAQVLQPETIGAWLTLAGLAVLAVTIGLMVAAALAARSKAPGVAG